MDERAERPVPISEQSSGGRRLPSCCKGLLSRRADRRLSSVRTVTASTAGNSISEHLYRKAIAGLFLYSEFQQALASRSDGGLFIGKDLGLCDDRELLLSLHPGVLTFPAPYVQLP